MANNNGMSYSELNYLNQIGIALDPSLQHNLKRNYTAIKTSVFKIPNQIQEPVPKVFGV